jgi:cholesterol oxidase
MDFDVIVVGSGFGGAITSCRLQENGCKVLVLERGRRWDKTNFPRAPTDPWLWDSEEPERHNGWLELRRFPNMAVAAGAAVGGGSLIYANISCEAPRERFKRGWPKDIRWYEELKQHYDTVARFMNVRPVPETQWPERTRLMKEAAEKAGFKGKFRPLELAVAFDDQWTYEKDFRKGAQASKTFLNDQGAEQGTCVHLGSCDIGCDVHAKNTLDRNYLYWAEKKGAQVRPLHVVTNIEPLGGGGYRVFYDELKNEKRVPGSQTARRVIAAAGSLGSTELLLRCKHLTRTLPNVSDYLGTHWSSNGDFLTPALYARPVRPSQGPTITSAIDLYDPDEDGGFWIEDGGFPDLVSAFIEHEAAEPTTGFKTKLLLSFMQRIARESGALENVMPWFAQGIDAGNGVLTLRSRSEFDPRPFLHLAWDIEASRRVIDRIVATHKKLSDATGGLALVPPTWTVFKDLVTPHPLGGCNMGDTPDNGVVNHKGEVFGYPGLYVADGAIVPEALGVNPSRTIGALAERTAALILAERN